MTNSVLLCVFQVSFDCSGSVSGLISMLKNGAKIVFQLVLRKNLMLLFGDHNSNPLQFCQDSK